jgi:hypothetical protein
MHNVLMRTGNTDVMTARHVVNIDGMFAGEKTVVRPWRNIVTI